ncbi:helix-turn-helix domain-containing protein [Pseudarthrobacter sp. LMD1-1-1.1]|uniref:helix-turn-helix domain-containing protein n=1 Tax=Pseudarthrobacter sp. LMD1-1-1.1 TaxID=3135242 RepID=UPI00343F2ED6
MAVLLGRSTGTVREYLQQGRIPGAIQPRGRWTVNRQAFEEWLEGKPAVMPAAKEVRAKHPPRPKWDNGDFRPPSDSLLNRQSEHTDFPTWGTTVPSGARRCLDTRKPPAQQAASGV